MAGAFWQAASFDQPLAKWDVSKVKYMGSMFYQAEAFNQPLNEWKVDKVENMAGMFWRRWRSTSRSTSGRSRRATTRVHVDEAAAFDREKRRGISEEVRGAPKKGGGGRGGGASSL